MLCKDVQQKIEAYHDGELTLSDRRDVEAHLDKCAECAAVANNLRLLSASIKHVGYEKTPASLRRNIRHELKEMTGEGEPSFSWQQLLGYSGGSAVAGAALTWFVMTAMPGMSLQNQPGEEIVSAHIRSMMVDHLTDITSSDRHTVKPWFAGKLDFSPQVIDLQEHGFPLAGGRLDYLYGRPAAVLVYKRRAHIINVFVRRADTTDATSVVVTRQQQGYMLISWKKQGLEYAVISDLNETELRQLAALLGNP